MEQKNISTKIRCAACGCEIVTVIILPPEEPKISNITQIVSLPSKVEVHRMSRKKGDPKTIPPSNPFGEHLRGLRAARGWSSYDLSNHSGVCHVAVKRIEAGSRSFVRDKTVAKLAKALGVSVEELKHPKVRVVPPGASGRPEGR